MRRLPTKLCFLVKKMQTAFEELKVKLTSTPVLSYPDYEMLFVVCTDASSRSVARVLSQADENSGDHTIDYAIRALSATESNYSAFEREALGVIFALKRFRHYLTSNRFKLYADHQALKYICNIEENHGRIARWFTLFRRNKYGIGFVSHIEMREISLKGLQDEVRHWGFNSTWFFCKRSFLMAQHATRSGKIREEL